MRGKAVRHRFSLCGAIHLAEYLAFAIFLQRSSPDQAVRPELLQRLCNLS
jgi:hypothetical protein